VVSEAAGDEKVFLGKSFATKAEATDETERANVAGLHVRLHAVQAECSESKVEHERKAFGQIAVSRARFERVVTDERAT
jgi:hypothetical protein